jgi:hypothetical protein
MVIVSIFIINELRVDFTSYYLEQVSSIIRFAVVSSRNEAQISELFYLKPSY